MPALETDGDALVVRLSRAEQLLAFRGDVRFPLSAITSVDVEPDPFGALRGIRAPGTGWPGVIAYGVRRYAGGRDFAARALQTPGAPDRSRRLGAVRTAADLDQGSTGVGRDDQARASGGEHQRDRHQRQPLDPDLRLAVTDDPLAVLLGLGLDDRDPVVHFPNSAGDDDLVGELAHPAKLDR